MKIAVIGGGISGISAAWNLARDHEVTLFEKNELGGHTKTHIITKGPDRGLAVDLGFIVLNDRNYPQFQKFLHELKVEVRFSDMSFAHYCERQNFGYAGTSFNGLFGQRYRFFQPRYWFLLKEVVRFGYVGLQALKQEDSLRSLNLGEFCHLHGFSSQVLQDYILPMGGAIWSSGLQTMLDFPALMFLKFFQHHGLLNLLDRPRWQTIVHGSQTYVDAFLAHFTGNLICPADCQIERQKEGIYIHQASDRVRFDALVLATHADISLKLLQDADEEEKNVLSSFRFFDNQVVLHQDEAVLPANKNLRASWNYSRELGSTMSDPVSLTYDMNRLMGLSSTLPLLVTLNRKKPISPAKILYRTVMRHPVYDKMAFIGQKKLPLIQGRNRTFYAGAWTGCGFHEDGYVSGLNAATGLNAQSSDL